MAAFPRYDSMPGLEDEPGRTRNALLLILLTWGIFFFWIGPRLWYQDLSGIFASYGSVAALATGSPRGPTTSGRTMGASSCGWPTCCG